MSPSNDLRCRGCAAPLPAPFLDLGRTPLANAYLKETDLDRPEPTFPLATAFCGSCHLVQLTHVVPPEQLFTEYLYFSSYSTSFLEHARRMAAELTEAYALGPKSKVLEIASNDGYLLRYFQERGIEVLGIEPARNIAFEAERSGVPTLNRFFGPGAVAEIAHRFGPADVIVGNNVFAHVPAVNEFLTSIRDCLAPRGVAVLEFPELEALLDRVEFDTIYHEHVFYFSLSAVDSLVRRAGLELFDVSKQPVHGHSLRVHLQLPGVRPIAPAVTDFLAHERAVGLTASERYTSFSARVAALREALISELASLRAAGKRVAAYGAPAKGNTLLNFCGITNTDIEFTVDRSPHKQGLFLPGSHIPVLAPEALVQRMPDVAVILPWNIAAEVVAQQREYVERGGLFLVPVPEPHVLAR